MHRSFAKPDQDALDEILLDKMGEILALIEAIAAEDQDADIKLAQMLDGEPEHVRIAIVEKLRELVRERAAEKEQQLDKYLEAQKRVEIAHQRNVFMQWLVWLMSEETLRKIREVFAARPSIEAQVRNIGEELAARGVLTQRQLPDKRELGGLSANVAQSQGQGRNQDKGRGT